MITTTTAEAPASLALMEHQILEHVKQALRVTLGWKTTPEGIHRKLSSVQFTLKSFLRHLERLMDLEERDGYLQYIEDRRPSLHDRINRLAQQHDDFRRIFHGLIPRIDSLSLNSSDDLDRVCQEVSMLLDEVDFHDRAEIDLLQESMLTDVGGEG